MNWTVILLQISFFCFVFGENGTERQIWKRGTLNGCENFERVVGAKTIEFPPEFQNREKPWMKKRVKLFTSESLTYNWNWFKELKVKSLNLTLTELLDFFEQNDCLFVAYGESVKDFFLGSIKETSPLKIEGETTCNVFKVFDLCQQKFGAHFCGVKPLKATDRVTFGIHEDSGRLLQEMIDPIIVSGWNLTFNRPKTQWEFTANAVGIYDNTAGKVYLIDMTGRSLRDICRRLINFPVSKEKWTVWASENLIKLLRYYNLMVDGFYAPKDVREFIIKHVRENFIPLRFQEYYCRFVRDGRFIISFGNSSSVIPECQVIEPDSRASRFIRLMTGNFVADYGPFWYRQMLPTIESMSFPTINFHEAYQYPAWSSYPNLDLSSWEESEIETSTSAEEFVVHFVAHSKPTATIFAKNKFKILPTKAWNTYVWRTTTAPKRDWEIIDVDVPTTTTHRQAVFEPPRRHSFQFYPSSNPTMTNSPPKYLKTFEFQRQTTTTTTIEMPKAEDYEEIEPQKAEDYVPYGVDE